MSGISDLIRKCVDDPSVSDRYGKWGVLTRTQRKMIRELCDACDMYERTADEFGLKLLEMGNSSLSADVAEVKHGKWHFAPEDLLDVTDAPKEEGWYRIITMDGEEATDYFFGEPTLTKNGVSYWLKSTKAIKAWAKMDGERSDTECKELLNC